MTVLAIILVAAPALLLGYAYVGYPAVLWLLGRLRRPYEVPGVPADAHWPDVTITVPAYNAERSLGATLDRLLELDYPKERLDIIVLSDASTDRTDDIARSYADRGVRLLRLPVRAGKTAAENLAVEHARAEIIVNVDAAILIPRDSLKPLVAAFADPSVGVASGRDISVGDVAEANRSESGYVGYEMWVRQLETRLGTIVGASGCFYGIRRQIHVRPLPPEYSWDFASALVAREHGLRAVSVDAAVCVVPRTQALKTELSRKVRTMARGLGTLLHKGYLMNPVAHGGFALMLMSHKLFRWLPYLLVPVSLVALAALATRSHVAAVLLAAAVAGIAAGTVGMRWPAGRRAPRPFALAGFALTTILAGALAWYEVARNRQMPTWEPTPRPTASAG